MLLYFSEILIYLMVIATNLIIYCNISVQQIQHECDAQVAQFTCVIEELRAKMRDMEAENRDKVGLFVFVSWFVFKKIYLKSLVKYNFDFYLFFKRVLIIILAKADPRL